LGLGGGGKNPYSKETIKGSPLVPAKGKGRVNLQCRCVKRGEGGVKGETLRGSEFSVDMGKRKRKKKKAGLSNRPFGSKNIKRGRRGGGYPKQKSRPPVYTKKKKEKQNRSE